MVSLANRIANRGSTPIGTIIPSGNSSVPAGYLACDGSAVSRTTYAALFSIIGTTFGVGDGSTTFNIPNTSGIFLRGSGSQTISAKSFNGGSVGNKQKDGTSQNGLSISTTSTPTLSIANTDLTHSHSYSDLTTSFSAISINNGVDVGSSMTTSFGNSTEGENTGSALGNHTHNITPSITGIVTSLSSTGTETRPACLTVSHFIKY